MKTATVTYVAPIGETKVCQWGDLTFEDGKAVEINDHDNPHLFQKLQGHPYFDFTMGKDQPDTVKPKVKRGRPSNLDKAAAKAAAEEADRVAKDAAEKAKEAKETHDALSKDDNTDKASGSTVAKPEKPYAPTPGSPGSPLPKPQGESNPVGLTGTSSAPTPSAPPPAGS
jgi:hypothetical protein